MPFGLLAGFGAALAWGTLDVITALASRVIGSLRVTAGTQSVSAFIFVALALITGTHLPTEPGSFAICALLGFIGAGAYLSYFTGLQYGPIAVVSGVVLIAFIAWVFVLSIVLVVAMRRGTDTVGRDNCVVALCAAVRVVLRVRVGLPVRQVRSASRLLRNAPRVGECRRRREERRAG
jgi:hypothetical protein